MANNSGCWWFLVIHESSSLKLRKLVNLRTPHKFTSSQTTSSSLQEQTHALQILFLVCICHTLHNQWSFFTSNFTLKVMILGMPSKANFSSCSEHWETTVLSISLFHVKGSIRGCFVLTSFFKNWYPNVVGLFVILGWAASCRTRPKFFG